MEMRSQFYSPADSMPFPKQYLGPDFKLRNTYSWDSIVKQVKVFIFFNATQIGTIGEIRINSEYRLGYGLEYNALHSRQRKDI